MIRIVLVDDHPIVRDGLLAVLSDEPDFEVVGAAPSAEDALRLVAAQTPDVVILDLELPGANEQPSTRAAGAQGVRGLGAGVEALPNLLRTSPGTKVIVFTAYDTEERVIGALRAGAKGYLLKGASSDEIAHAIRTVHAGGSHLTPRVAATVLAELSGDRSRAGRGAQSPAALTAREREVLRLVADGRSNKEIARELSITERTAKFHVTSLLNKLGADNRAQAAALAVQRGLL